MSHEILSAEFYERDTLSLARALLGKRFVHKVGSQILSGIIVETEAYHEEGDPSCHAYKGKTERNSVMFGSPGRLYVYFTYGMHFCMNVVSEPAGIGAAVLIRAIEPIEGIESMYINRGEKIAKKNLCNGPAKLCQAFNITKKENGHDLCNGDIFISDDDSVLDDNVVTTTRIGISKGKELPWRFYIKGNTYVSKK